MPELPSAGGRSRLRARRWDAIVVGSALPGLVAAARLCHAGRRVLVLEEERASQTFAPARDPFVLTGAHSGGILAVVLRELSVPLIDVRRIEADPLAYQVIFPEARIDVGNPARTAEELVTWGLAKPDTVQPLLRALGRAAAAERDAMLASPVLRAAGLRRLGRSSASPTRHARGMPAEASDPAPELVPFFEAQVRALSNLASVDPGPEARARLLGAALEGGARFPTSGHTLRRLLVERIHATHGEVRRVGRGFELVSADGEPGVAPERSTELWLARVLVVNAPRGLLGDALRRSEAGVPGFLDVSLPPRRRLTVHLRTPAEVIPEGMARRVIRVADPAAPLEGANLVTVAVHPGGGDVCDVLASARVEGSDDRAAREAEIEAAVRHLMPFSAERLTRQATEPPQWDDDGALEDPGNHGGWPAEVDIRISSRPPVYQLPRSALGALGMEGDLLLGWRAGERLVADLG